MLALAAAVFVPAALSYAPQAAAESLAAADSLGGGTLPLEANPLHGSDGTLPLQLPNSGTLPLKLSGSATANGHSAVTTSVTVTSAAAQPSALGAIGCQTAGASVTQHAASGMIQVANASYLIKGICFDHGSNTLEIVGANAGGASSLAAPLATAVPPELNGRLVITGAGANAGHYLFDLRGP